MGRKKQGVIVSSISRTHLNLTALTLGMIMDDTKFLKIVSFLVKDTHMCVDIKHIKKILPLPYLEELPGCPSYLVGLMNMGGKTVPVMDLSMRLGMRRVKKYSLDMSLMLCVNGLHQAGLVVDKILGLVDVNEALVQTHEDFEKEDSLFLGSISLNGGLALFIDVPKLMTGEKGEGEPSSLLKRSQKNE